MIRQNLEPLIEGKEVRLITLTLRADDESLAQRISRLYRAFAKLRKHPVWRNNVTAAVSFLEITRGKHGLHWHTHVHVIATGKYIAHSSLKAAWLYATGDSWIVDVRACKSPEQLTRYVTKYVTKAIDAKVFRDDSTLDEAIRTLQGVRMVTTLGEWRGQPILQYVPTDSWHFVMNWPDLMKRCQYNDPHALALYFHIRDKPFVCQDVSCNDDCPDPVPRVKTTSDELHDSAMQRIRDGERVHPRAVGLSTYAEVDALIASERTASGA